MRATVLGLFFVIVGNAQPNSLVYSAGPRPDIEIAAVGDILMHYTLQKQAKNLGDTFYPMLAPVANLIREADVAYGNFEGPASFRNRPVERGDYWELTPRRVGTGNQGLYSAFPNFNYPSFLVGDLIEAGFDVLSLANNHSIDRRGIGVNRTIESIEHYSEKMNHPVAYSGTIHSQRRTETRIGITETRTGHRIAWFSCAGAPAHLNGNSSGANQVVRCTNDRKWLLQNIRKYSLRSDIDAVIVTPHWGNENTTRVLKSQKRLARDLINAGATAVIGSHPHVLQGWEKITADDGRESFVIYSLGNFISNQNERVRGQTLRNRTSIILYLGLKEVRGRLEISNVEYVPIMVDRGGRHHKVIAIPNALNSGRHNSPRSVLQKGLKIVKGLFGAGHLRQ